MTDHGGPVADRVRALVQPILDDLGLELYDCEFGGGVLRVTADKVDAALAGGVDLDELSLVTRMLSRELDHGDVVPGRYTLEVSSPGLERPLRTAGHFRWALGRDVVVRRRTGNDDERRIAGVVSAVGDDDVTIVSSEGPASGSAITVPLDDIDRARSVFVWQPTPKPGGPRKRSASKPSALAPGGDDSDINDDSQEVAAP